MGTYPEQGVASGSSTATTVAASATFKGNPVATDMPDTNYEFYMVGSQAAQIAGTALCYAVPSPWSGLPAIPANANADVVINAALTNMATIGGILRFQEGIYTINAPVVIPNGNYHFMFIGSGIPTMPALSGPGTAGVVTPSDGTQWRATAAGFNSAGAGINILGYNSGSGSNGKLTLQDFAIMPAWGTTSASTVVYCLRTTGNAGSGTPRYVGLRQNMLFVPWGWLEATPTANPLPASTNSFTAMALNLGGSGAQINIAYCNEYAMYNTNSNLYSDYLFAQRLFYHNCQVGDTFDQSCALIIDELALVTPNTYGISINTNSAQFSMLSHVRKIFVESYQAPANQNFINFTATNGYLKCDLVDVSAGGAQVYAGQVNVTNNDQLHLLYPCYVRQGGGAQGQLIVQAYPRAVELTTTAFGGTITDPFVGTSIGSGGSATFPTSATTYTANLPVDFTMSGGTVSASAIKDNYGNTISSSTTPTHVLMLPGYTVKVTWSVQPTVTVVQATLGTAERWVGTTATAQVGVNYYCLKRTILTNLTTATCTLTVLDGSTNAGGGTVANALAVPIPYYCVEAGQIVQFGTAAPVAGTGCVVAQQ